MATESRTHEELAGLLASSETVQAKLALRRTDDGWRLDHVYATVNSPARPPGSRLWRYAHHAFLEQQLAGRVLADLLTGTPQQIDDMLIAPCGTVANALYQRFPSHRPWKSVTLPWPVSEWTVSRADSQVHSQTGLLVGDGPSFLNVDAAFASFMFGSASGPDTISQYPLWRVDVVHPEAYFHRVTVLADGLVIDVRGSATLGSVVQLSSPTSDTTRRVGNRRRIQISRPEGVADQSLLVLRRNEELLDYRYLTYSPGNLIDQSVVWEQPELGLQLLIASGEGQQTEFKSQLPMDNSSESRRTMLKTVAAFASGAGGTILFGVSDDGTIAGLDPAEVDAHRDRLVHMIRDLISPEPRYTIRVHAVDDRVVLALQIQQGTRGAYALFPSKPEFYVRRGATTYRARVEEIAATYAQR